MKKIVLDNFALNDSKYQIKLEKYLIHKRKNSGIVDTYTKEEDELLVHTTIDVPIIEPKITIWEYLSKEDLEKFMSIKKKNDVKIFINENLATYPKGFARIVFQELICSVRNFCMSHNFNLEQTGAILSQFYLTHSYFTSKISVGAEKLYHYFKDIQLCHSLPFPPNNVKLFNLEEIKSIMVFFCKIYLRNLPLIRFLSLPNYALCLKYELEPESPLLKKGKKDKKGKKKGKGGKKKKKK